jgi:hypothetical protein
LCEDLSDGRNTKGESKDSQKKRKVHAIFTSLFTFSRGDSL